MLRLVKNSKAGSTARLVDHVAETTLPKDHILHADPLINNAKKSKPKCIKRKDLPECNGNNKKICKKKTR
jgi:hypothetical protein